MSSTDRSKPSRDRPEPEGTPRDHGRARTGNAPVEPPQYFDPTEPWDERSAEALAHLYESGEGYLHRRPEDEHAHRARSMQPQAHAAAPAGDQTGHDHAWLEARLAGIAERLHDSLSEINPDKAVAQLNGRLDAIEERFNAALSQVVQRSDLDGLKLIEAHVMELAAHVEHTRGRLDRIDAIDDQMQNLANRIGEGGHQRLDALEKLLQDYVTEWRKGDERTSSTLRGLEDVVNRVGESIEAIEAHKPAPDLSLSALDVPGLDDPAIERDPLSQVYAAAARSLEPATHRSSLDAADYAPKGKSDAEVLPLPTAQERRPPPPGLPQAEPTRDSLPSPSLLVSMMRNTLRQALGAGERRPSEQPATGAAGAEPAAPSARRSRPNLLLAGGITLFAAIGYLLVDVLMSTSVAPRRPAEAEYSGRTDGAKTTPVLAGRAEDATPASPKVARIEALGHVMAAAFRQREETERPAVESTASIQKDTPATPDEALSPPTTSLPMTIGPASMRQAAMRGDASAQMEVASRYAAGQGVGRDLQQAFQWYGRAATQGLAVAQYRFAALYERGLGTARDPERARVWYARAAAQGNVKAMHNLAVLSVSGGRTDYATAAKWFAQAADFGLADSQVNLAILYQSGLGVPRDMTLAYKWLALAKRGGDQEAAGRVTQVRARLGTAELEAVDATIAAWRAQTPDRSANEAATVDASELSQ